MAELEAKAGADVDRKTGAPARVRALVGGVDDPEGRLATARQFFPDAEIADGNIVFTHPETGRRTLLNPPGFDRGDIPGVAREAAQFVGGGIGTALGSLGGPPGAIAGAGLGTAAGETLFNVAARAAGMKDPRSVGEQAVDTATVGALGAAGQGVGMAAGKGFRLLTKKLLGNPSVAAGAAADAARFGAAPASVGQASGNRAAQAIESALGKTPGSAGRMAKVAERQSEALRAQIERKATALAGRSVDDVVAGRTLMTGVDDFVTRFNSQADALYGQLRAALPNESRVPLASTKTALTELTRITDEVPGLDALLTTPTTRGVAGAVAQVDDVSFEALSKIRSAVGRKLSTPSLVSDIPRAELKHLYAALSKDMEAAARANGPEAIKAFQRANAYWKAGMARVDDVLEPLVKNRAPEQVFAALERGGQSGPTQVRAVLRSLTPPQQRIVQATVIQRLGMAAPSKQGAEGGEFALDRFLTNWNRLHPQARKALFRGQMADDMDALARMADASKKGAQVFANPSGTAGASAAVQMGTLSAGSALAALTTGQLHLLMVPVAIIGTAGGANMAARLMTSPRFVRWMASGTQMAPGGMSAHIGKLAAIAKHEDAATQEAIQAYSESLTGALEAPSSTTPSRSAGP